MWGVGVGDTMMKWNLSDVLDVIMSVIGERDHRHFKGAIYVLISPNNSMCRCISESSSQKIGAGSFTAACYPTGKCLRIVILRENEYTEFV